MIYVKETIKELYRTTCMQGRLEYLRLDMNENPNGLPEEFVETVKKEITPAFLATYPEPEKLEHRIADYLKINCKQICITNGSDEAIRFIFELFTRSGKEVVSVSPTFEMYRVYCKMFGLIYREISYSQDFKINVDELLSSIHEDTDLVVLVNPNNPIGTVFSLEEVKSIIEKAREYNTLVIIDEAYHYFYRETFLPLIEQYNNIILLRTFSKLMSLAACRLGFSISNAELTSYMKKARPSFNVNAIALKFGEKILQNDELIEALIKKERKGKQYLLGELKKLGYEVHALEGNFLFFRPKTKPDELASRLKKEKILVKTFGNDVLKNYIRITIAEKKNMEYFLEKLQELDD